jgi:hypothetical protein
MDKKIISKEISDRIKTRLDSYQNLKKHSELESNLMQRLLAVEINELMVKRIALKY